MMQEGRGFKIQSTKERADVGDRSSFPLVIGAKTEDMSSNVSRL